MSHRLHTIQRLQDHLYFADCSCGLWMLGCSEAHALDMLGTHLDVLAEMTR